MRFPAFLPAALLASFALAGAAHAAPTLGGVNLGEHVCGPKITPKDLQGRVVVFEYWGVNCPPCLASIPHLAELQEKYNYRFLIVVANQCQGGSAANAAKVWKERKGGDKAAVIHNGDIPGSNVTSIPRVFVFDAAGRLAFDGRPSDPKFTQTVDKAIKNLPGAAAAAKKAEAGMNRIQAAFGDQAIPDELLKLAFQASNTTRSSEGALKTLAMAAKSKNVKLADAAKAMLAAFDDRVAARFAEAEKLAESEPAKAWSTMEMLTQWVPQKEEGVKAQKQFALWRRDAAFLKELAADKAWLALKAQADKIDFEKNPKAKPTSRLESDFKKLLKDKDFAGTQGLERAKAAAPSWKLDPETGRADKFKPQVTPAEPTAAAEAAPEQPAAESQVEAPAPTETPAEQPAETPAADPGEPADANKSVLGA